MNGQLELLRWIPINRPVLTAAVTGNGQYIAIGTELGAAVHASDGRLLFSVPSADSAVHQVTATTDLGQIYTGNQLGAIVRLDLERERDILRGAEYPLFYVPDGVHTMALAGDGTALAIGHLSAALSVIDSDGALLWRHHPDDGTPTEGQIWSVALDTDGSMLYAGSGGVGTNMLLTLDGRSGTQRARQYLRGQVTAIAALPNSQGVVASMPDDPYSGRLVAFPTALGLPLWEHRFEAPVTTFAVDREQDRLVTAVGYEGQIVLLDTTDGHPITEQLPLQTIVNTVAITQGRTLVASTQDGHVAVIRCLL